MHIIGLEERKEKSKKLIGRKDEGKRDNGSLIENAIKILNYEDCLRDIKNPSDYGESKDEQLYHVALELSITWINRILFLKLLEGQLVKYHNGDTSYKFLNSELITDYDALNKLFFHVLAVKENERGDHVKEKYKKIPYLNSSLFEPNELEHRTIRISNLEDDYTLPILNGTVLKDNVGKKRSGKLNPLNYLFDFLDAYDFSSEGAEDISEENKTLINASVLGLIFEKINGYKDGSFFTPGFITMYMCRETIRRAVVQKFNDAKGWKCDNLEELYNKIDDKKEANEIINSLKICDPAVGSGHFLVSALNEIIAIKSELKILADSKGKVLRDYHVEVINDELVITDEDGEFFEYHPKNPESQRIQETLFHEKQTIIENCLFGVDINQNSVKICRLRLWIELLKNAYYRPDSGFTELETLPNIDINIKCGNSLISRYPLNADIKSALAKSKWTIDSYRLAVMSYRNAENKEEKVAMRKLIEEIKSDFESEVSSKDKRFLRLHKLKGELFSLTGQHNLFEMEGKKKDDWEKKLKKASAEIEKLETELEEIRTNKIYENAFEWRFEFPEVLNDEGDFVGFDVVIGNPPYISAWEMHENDENQREEIKNIVKNGAILTGHWDLYMAFILLSIEIGKPNSYNTYIIPNPFLREKYAALLRKHLLDEMELISITLFETSNVFDEVARRTIIYLFKNALSVKADVDILETNTTEFRIDFKNTIDKNEWRKSSEYRFNTSADNNIFSLLEKIESHSYRLGNICYVNYGAQVSSKIKGGFKKSEVVGKIEKGNSKRFVEGKDVHRWELAYRNLWLDYRKDELYGPRFEELFEAEKLLIRKISDKGHRVAATFDDNGYYTDDGCVIAALFTSLKNVLPKNTYFDYEVTGQEYKISFVLSQLLSSVTTFYFKNRFSTESLQGETSHTYPKSIRALPVMNASIEQQKEITSIATKVLEIKSQDVNANISELENIMDKLFYSLYGLSKTEIELLENNINK
ncbi:MAG: Eco57I restriction-modification methylase domain-containing protein [Bacteroidales bacterium]|nr:Eco57I restriction-modification methylase domain-containing protein [Bacteroidales bacterium]